jgi:hypothetical protein
MKIEILDQAKRDLIEGFYFYEAQDQGLGTYFLSRLYSDIESLRVTARAHFKAYRDYYRLLSERFPFAVYNSQGRYHCDSSGCGLPARSSVDSSTIDVASSSPFPLRPSLFPFADL